MQHVSTAKAVIIALLILAVLAIGQTAQAAIANANEQRTAAIYQAAYEEGYQRGYASASYDLGD